MPLTTAIHTGRAATIIETTTFYTLPNCDVEAASERAGNKSYAKTTWSHLPLKSLGKKARQRTSNHVIHVGLPIEMSNENFNFESLINFMKFMKLSRGTFEGFIEILKWNYLSLENW